MATGVGEENYLKTSFTLLKIDLVAEGLGKYIPLLE